MADRRRRRGVLLVLGTLPLALIAVVFAAKLLSLPALASAGADEYERGEWSSSAATFSRLEFWNAFEPWIAHFNAGTAQAAGGDFARATNTLSTALALAPENRRCEVRVNLARAWEQEGDVYADAGQLDGAAQLYQAALAVIAAGEKEGCFEPQKSGADDELKSAKQRLEDKLRSSTPPEQQPDADENGGNGDENVDGGGPFDELEERGKDAEREKQDGDSERRGGGGGGGRDDTDKPW